MALTAGILAAAVAIAHGSRGWWIGWSAATIIMTLAGVVSLVPLVPGIMAGGQWAIYGYLASTVTRLFVVLLACIAAVMIFRVPAVQTLTLVAPMYLVQLVVEAIVASRSLPTTQGSLRTQ
jgi:hypothetical protein